MTEHFSLVGNDKSHELVFVYGSLKNGFGNNVVLQRTNSVLIGSAVTEESIYSMISFGSFPGVYRANDQCETPYRIQGELYAVNKKGMRNLDTLESNGSFYQREVTKIRIDDKTTVDAWMYLLLVEDRDLQQYCSQRISISDRYPSALTWGHPVRASQNQKEETCLPSK